MLSVKAMIHRLPEPVVVALRSTADRLVPRRRVIADQWRRIDAAVAPARDLVQSGPFRGMQLGLTVTGSHIPKRLGSYEAELHPWIDYFITEGYERVVDVGCGEGFYVVGLALRMPDTELLGFDISPIAQEQCRAAALLNGVANRVSVSGACSADALAGLASDTALVVIDAEGAEEELVDGPAVPAVRSTDLVVELHEFAAPGVTERLLDRLQGSHECRLVDTRRRDPSRYPLLHDLAPMDASRAVDESRPEGQQWLIALSRRMARRAPLPV